MNEFRSHFPILKEEVTFLNHCVVSPIPDVAVAASHQFLLECATHGINIPKKDEALKRCRQRSAKLLNADPDEIAFVGNTSQGINTVANGIRWRPGDVVVTCDIEYPDNFYPWKYLERKGVKTIVIRSREGRITVDDVKKALVPRTRLVSLSLVQFLNGFRLDATSIGELCRERKILFLLDAIQGLGAVEMDTSRVPVDFIAAGGQKWLLSPLGSGIFYCRREALEELEISTIGQGSMAPASFPLPYHSKIRPNAARFEGGPAKNVPSLYGLDASLDILLRAGIPAIQRKVLGLTAYLIDALLSRGYIVHSPHDHDEERSGIVAFSHPKIAATELLSLLGARGIAVSSPNGAWLRVAPHFYNDKGDLLRFLEALP